MKSSILAVTLVLLAGIAPASAQWARSYGDAGFEMAFAIRNTSDGGSIVSGATVSFGAGDYDCWLLKLNADGGVQWQKTYGGAGFDEAYSVEPTTDGGYFVAAITTSFGAGGYDLWALKLDASGNVQWQKTYGGNGFDFADSVRQTSDGGFILAGGTDSSGAGNRDVWILKLNAAGGVQWQKTLGSAQFDQANSVQTTSDGGYVVAADTSFGAGSFDVWILKLDISGNTTWQQTYGGAGADSASSVQQTSDGGYVVAGGTESFGAGASDLWILKLGTSGSIQWQKTYGDSGGERAYSVQQTADGYYAAGVTTSFGFGDSDAWILKLDSSGNVQWQKAYGSTQYDQVNAIDGNGGLTAAGYTASFGVGGDLWVLKLASDGQIDPSCTLATDTFVVAAGSLASISVPSAAPASPVAQVADSSAIPTDSAASVGEQCAVACLFCDDFEDGLLDPAWSYLKPAWSESGGDLIAIPAKKALAIASPAFAGCSDCSFEAAVTTAGGTGNKISVFAWYADKGNNVEIIMKEESDKFIVKQRAAGTIVAKGKATATVLPNVSYDIKITFDGSAFTLLINGNPVATLPAGATPNGTIGFQVKGTTAHIGQVLVE